MSEEVEAITLDARLATFEAEKRGEELLAALRKALGTSTTRVVDVFRQWDLDGSGTVDKAEFRKAIQTLGVVSVQDNVIDALFARFDRDGSNTLEYRELNRVLRQGQDVQLESDLYAGATGEVTTKATTAVPIRSAAQLKKPTAIVSSVGLRADSDKSIADLLTDIVAQNVVRVTDLFREWDTDGSGTVSKKEFRRAIGALGYEAPRAELDRAFAEFDTDRSGEIDVGELTRALKRRVDLNPALLPGAAGAIVTESRNKVEMRRPPPGYVGRGWGAAVDTRTTTVPAHGACHESSEASTPSSRALEGCHPVGSCVSDVTLVNGGTSRGW